MLKDYDNMDLYLPRAFILVAHLRVYHLPNLGTHSYVQLQQMGENSVLCCSRGNKKISTMMEMEYDMYIVSRGA